MKITIELDTITDDLADMIAIFDAIGQRAADFNYTNQDDRPIYRGVHPDDTPDRMNAIDAPPPPASESAIAAEAARVASDVPPPPANAPAGPVDSAGTPWDERIHAASKGKNADGQYKRRKGVDVPTYDRIATELRAGRVNVPPAPIDNAGTESAAAAATPANDVPPPPPPTSADVPPAPPAATTDVPPPPVAAGGITAQEVLADMGRRALTYDQNGELARAIGLTGVQDILSAPVDKLQALAAMIVTVHGPVA